MKILKRSILVSSYAVLTVLLFFGGYAMGNIRKNETVLVSPQPVEAVDAISSVQNLYYLKLESDTLNLYSVSNGEKTLITGEKISSDIYPSDDVKDLLNGVTFDNIEDAQALFENFVS